MSKKRGPKQKHNNHKEWTRGWRYKTDAPHNREWKEDRKNNVWIPGEV